MAYSAFTENGLQKSVKLLISEIQEVYLADYIPWVVGYSGGKDSSATLQLVWYAISELPIEKRIKPIHVISTDTLVENPIVALWQEKSLKYMAAAAKEADLPIIPHRLTPAVKDTFWVKVLGKGYPAPRQGFRWCTLRLKINPSNTFITNLVQQNGEAIVVLGTRKAESSARARSMTAREQKRTRKHLSPNPTLPNSLVYSPIEAWGNDDVWTYLMQYENPWGMKNSSLLTMYASASEDHECPLVLDSETPSCGDSRFGCWICTLVDKDKSMTAMIQNDEEKEWMFPLLELRDQLDFRGDEKRAREAERRDFRRMDGAVHYNRFSDGVIPGPYTQKARCEFLELVFKAQRWISEHAPADVAHYKIITTEELREIRRIWVVEKHEFEDLLPAIYKKVFGVPFDDSAQYNTLLFSQEDLDDLRSLCADDIQYQTIRELLDVERKYKTSQRRAGLFENLEHAIKKGFFSDIEEAKNSVRERHEKKSKIEQMRAAENIDDDLTNFLTAMINGENYDN